MFKTFKEKNHDDQVPHDVVITFGAINVTAVPLQQLALHLCNSLAHGLHICVNVGVWIIQYVHIT